METDIDCGSFTYVGNLQGHKNRITTIQTTADESMLITASRDKNLIIWRLNESIDSAAGTGDPSDETSVGIASKALTGHNGIVSDVCVAEGDKFAISASYDKTLRLWDLERGVTLQKFKGHEKEVLSVCVSHCHTIVYSSGMDNVILKWNIRGDIKETLNDRFQHTDYITAVRYIKKEEQPDPFILSCGFDNLLKKWSAKNSAFLGNVGSHSASINCLSVSPDSTLCATGCTDGHLTVWDGTDTTPVFVFQAKSTVHSIAFAPSNYWIFAATHDGVIAWDVETRKQLGFVGEINKNKYSNCPISTSIRPSRQGEYLFVGSNSGNVNIYKNIAATDMAQTAEA